MQKRPYFRYFASGFYVEQDRNRLYVVETDEPVKIVYPVATPPPEGSTLQARPPADLTPSNATPPDSDEGQGHQGSYVNPAYETVAVDGNENVHY